ncbi:hypothetical protein NDU88_005845 [Pleurodeles waltl]|uniref:Uncharacterized protein n=1 Tax=Pleurodeles waltl TaxID=8319 RepID=A0AAV7TCK3_PLEWA|nr:hypothetical protein NDU88_005845 [Pleurodeles waltl]
MSRESGFAPQWARDFYSRWVKLLERGPFWSQLFHPVPRCFLVHVPPYLLASSRHEEVSVSQTFCPSGAGPVTPLARGDLHVAHARLGRRRRIASFLRYLEGYGPREAALSASSPLGGASAGSARLSPAGGARPPRRQEPGHLQSGSAAGPHGSGPTRFSLGRDRLRLLFRGAGGGGHPRRGLSGFGRPCLISSAREPAPRLRAPGVPPLRRGPVFGTASFQLLTETSEPRTRVHGVRRY